MDESPIITMLKQMMSTLTDEERSQLEEAVGEKLKSLEADISNVMDPAQKRVVDYLYKHRHLGAALYEVAEEHLLDNEVTFDDLPVPKKMYWTKLALTINFDPDNLRCICPECLAEEDESNHEHTCGHEDESDEGFVDGEDLPEPLKSIMRKQGIDLSNARVKVMQVSRD